MRIDSSMVEKQFTGVKSEIHKSPKISQGKEDVVKQSEKKEENVSFPGEKKLIEAVEKANKDLVGANSHLKFSIHEKTKEIMIKIVDNDTDEVIKELPPENIVDMIAEMCEKAGIFVDKRG
ncbi:flagellar protein FlaG [Tepidibacter hydrothermalis]|uniref:Flagellar protein FlaG n=1 Tax=Tepidibacter hydrothermalis TaxID=3036126 RepID=A0ABY8EAT7_9FIRM|nr:flagellar protein FlaG [Tepidibacter hydrothermalis]WFD10031.1 flagellar protein FlaG [Tepidibacter hydrothermalis]